MLVPVLCYMNYHILRSKYPPMTDTHACSPLQYGSLSQHSQLEIPNPDNYFQTRVSGSGFATLYIRASARQKIVQDWMHSCDTATIMDTAYIYI